MQVVWFRFEVSFLSFVLSFLWVTRKSGQKSMDVVRVESSRSDRIPSRPASSEIIPSLGDPCVVQKLHMAYEEIAALYYIR